MSNFLLKIKIKAYFLCHSQYLPGLLYRETIGKGRVGTEDNKRLPLIRLLKELAHRRRVCLGRDSDTSELEDMAVGVDQGGTAYHLTPLLLYHLPDSPVVTTVGRQDDFQDVGGVKTLLVEAQVTIADVIGNLSLCPVPPLLMPETV